MNETYILGVAVVVAIILAIVITKTIKNKQQDRVTGLGDISPMGKPVQPQAASQPNMDPKLVRMPAREEIGPIANKIGDADRREQIH